MSSGSDVDAKLHELIPLLTPDQKQNILGRVESMLGGKLPGGATPSELAKLSGTMSRETAEELKRIIAEGKACPPWPKRAKARDLRELAGSISPEDLDVMTRVIEEDCERIDPHGW